MKTLSEHGRLGIAQQFDYSKFLLYSLITQSTAIEGSTVTEVENQLLFDEGIPPEKHNLSEVMMNLDLLNAYQIPNRLQSLPSILNPLIYLLWFIGLLFHKALVLPRTWDFLRF